MAVITDASKLEVGDILAPVPSTLRMGDVRRVTGLRTVRGVETYQLVEFEGVDGTGRGEISLRSIMLVTVLHPVLPEELPGMLAEVEPGESFQVYRGKDGVFYA
ncbi:hypothetical protein SEA_BANANAFISH_77 [Mycobacterium phage Bananafish]|uniref:Uncharacterized protein n=5 Tax=Rosebushvirus TaxID=1982900 RepID=S5WJZ0_9CAUD|nr:hypothetical protein FPF50_gp79 [Mycobacterium phage TA17A]YP_010012445.1 hypothetical protein J3996_gp77 [Mycobacterium phage Laurie]AER48698.1 hypothetical protein ARES_76 [Mycobacterium phage Ares]AIK68850.1 hypothetical protein PBI_LIZLEMON_76 [Mycobacterium phage LizLemon]QCG77139.1 hypothetical protein SEA_BANANAFISH_77 [Mycobacterium phage Bananafish]AGS81480.1 hypothetical protein TA17A_79 [Mycobacterium phage TA17A]ANZ52371.1 hypothetical protein SEA_LAURIE_77 [Mycobacterium phage